MATRRSTKTQPADAATDGAANGKKGKQAPTRSGGLLVPNIGLTDQARGQVCDILNACLSNTFVLYTKTRNYHWNVTGIEFIQLHQLFEEQYEQLDVAMDAIAERVRQVGGIAFGTLQEFKSAAKLGEQPGERPNAVQMVRNLLDDHEAVIRQLRQDAETADELKDVGTNDFLTGLVQEHEKMAWFLRAHLED
ncbi:MAG: DNA starvation/stationary phase protection protein [Chloroflexota bacterium]|nr:DNA starvation/stationary phase protection protein [Chloroflexota bacterium]